MKLLTAVNRSIAAMRLNASDEAAMELARQQARVIDADPEAIKKLGPHLLESLAALGLTPKARNEIVKGGTEPGDGDSDKITELRSRRERRATNLV